ncbi:MAG: hypothetical protein JST55_15715 [Bacteroidetes bacterium]|nr:hypothetical protein [Bacteroidota bacterium]
MDKELLQDSLGWGFILWLIGYVLGMTLFFVVPTYAIGWVIMPVALAITLWVLFKRVKADTIHHYIIIAFVWAFMAIVLDFLFIVKALNPPDGYYKTDVYIYYLLMFFLPLIVSTQKIKKHGNITRHLHV